MDLIQAVILAIIQGLTEWLPISSSGHLVIAQRALNLSLPVGFYAALHLGTLLAVLVYFRKEILSILIAFLRADVKSKDFRLGLYVISGTLPTVLLALLLRGYFESLFSSPQAASAGLLLTGVLLLSSKARRGFVNVDLPRSLLTGLFQGFSIAPGISRSGATISVALLSGVEIEEAFRYSFILSIPAIIGANVLEFGGAFSLGYLSLVGFLIAALTGYIAIGIVRRVLLTNKLYLFSPYCFALALLSLTVL
ncbi:MAG: undecaprenyl-diphosphate phosphatase [Candidatus Methanomethylicaceae archaeon]